MSHEIKVTVILQGSPQKKNCWSGAQNTTSKEYLHSLQLFVIVLPASKEFLSIQSGFWPSQEWFSATLSSLRRTLVLDKKASLLLVVPFTVSPSAIVTLYRLRECMSLETQRQLQLLFQVFKHYCHPGPYILHFKNKK